MPEDTRQFAARVPGDHTVKICESMYHAVHNELPKADLIAYMIASHNAHVA